MSVHVNFAKDLT